jgi:penicillin-binding protein 1A
VFGRTGSLATLLVVIVFSALAGYVFSGAWRATLGLPDAAALDRLYPSGAIEVFDRFDRLVCTIRGDEYSTPVNLSLVSSHMRKAILAAEDRHFYRHAGISLPSMIRATASNLRAGRIVEGGSTITQQLVKNMFFKHEDRTIWVKLKEICLALELEKRHGKESILAAYLNNVYFGNGAWGIERAANAYFAKPASRLNLAESAYLAALVKAPSDLSSPANHKSARKRQHHILDKMADYGLASRQDTDMAKRAQLVFSQQPDAFHRNFHYLCYVQELLRQRLGREKLFNDRLRVYTALDPQAQALAEQALAGGIRRAPRGVNQGALVSISVKDNSVLAMVGGVGDFWLNQFNRATNPHTAGSAFKPFVYMAALRYGLIGPDTLIDDFPLTITTPASAPYTPKNFDGRFAGLMTVRQALARSSNLCAVRVGLAVGIEKVVETARLAGIESRMDPFPSLALGSCAVSPLEMANAYATLARYGVFATPVVIRRVEDTHGKTVALSDQQSGRVFGPEPVAQLVDVLETAVERGTGRRARLPDRPAAGKTGTSDESRDVWFIGFTPEVVTAVWGGNDDNRPVGGPHVTGGAVMARIWRDYSSAYYRARPAQPASFVKPLNRLRDDFLAEYDEDGVWGGAVEGLVRQLWSDNGARREPGRREPHHTGFVRRIWRGIMQLF